MAVLHHNIERGPTSPTLRHNASSLEFSNCVPIHFDLQIIYCLNDYSYSPKRMHSNFRIDHYIPIQWDVQKRLVQPAESSSYPSAHWKVSKKLRLGHAKSFGHRAAHGWLPLQIAVYVSITPGRAMQDWSAEIYRVNSNQNWDKSEQQLRSLVTGGSAHMEMHGPTQTSVPLGMVIVLLVQSKSLSD